MDAPPPPSTGRIAQGLNEGDKLLEQLHQELSMLENRIATFLRPQGPESGNNKANPANVAPSQLAEALVRHNDAIMHAIYRLRNIAERVDL